MSESRSLTVEQLSSLVISGLAFSVKTEPAQRLLVWLAWLVTRGRTGGAVIGIFRQGKTLALRWALHSLSSYIDENAGFQIPWIHIPLRPTDLPDDRPSAFFRFLLRRANHEHYKDGSGDDRHDNFLDLLVTHASRSPFKCFILAFDEAQLLTLNQLLWLHSVGNELERNQLRLIVLLVGTRKLEVQKSQLLKAQNGEVVARYFLHTLPFSGLGSETELTQCLGQFDNVRYPPNSERVFPALFVQEAWEGGFRLQGLGAEMWTHFDAVWKKAGMGSRAEVPMLSATTAVVHLLLEMRSRGEKRAAGDKDLNAAVAASGYADLIELYKASIVVAPSARGTT